MDAYYNDFIITIDDSDEKYNEMNIALEKEERKYLMLRQLGQLYDNVFGSFRSGNKVFYNPNIFAKLTKQKFINWAIHNNTELMELFN